MVVIVGCFSSFFKTVAHFSSAIFNCNTWTLCAKAHMHRANIANGKKEDVNTQGN